MAQLELPELPAWVLKLATGEEILLTEKGWKQVNTKSSSPSWCSARCTDVEGTLWAINPAHIVSVTRVQSTGDDIV